MTLTVTFKDIFRTSFLDQVTAVPLFDMVLALGLAFALGLFIFFVYKRSYAGVMYSASFGVTLIGLCLITTLVILAVTSNVVLSLGMVGALSIVRFRTAIKDPMDIVFLFWSITVGIVLAAGFIPLAVFGSIFIGLILLVFSSRKNLDRPYILVLQCSDEATERAVREQLDAAVRKVSLKSKSIAPGLVELNYEVRLREGDSSFVHRLAELEGVGSLTLVSYNGDYMS